ncbi:PAS domain S-box protein [Polyangium fumosum]|uniref:PAS domain S-box protein n=2 Tax=Polyangium fumosum TaxID=889272 RepID=A0A4V5PLQ2_9BACT|nr:PAS domain S-box protein [Polyangium fumosum]
MPRTSVRGSNESPDPYIQHPHIGSRPQVSASLASIRARSSVVASFCWASVRQPQANPFPHVMRRSSMPRSGLPPSFGGFLCHSASATQAAMSPSPQAASHASGPVLAQSPLLSGQSTTSTPGRGRKAMLFSAALAFATGGGVPPPHAAARPPIARASCTVPRSDAMGFTGSLYRSRGETSSVGGTPARSRGGISRTFSVIEVLCIASPPIYAEPLAQGEGTSMYRHAITVSDAETHLLFDPTRAALEQRISELEDKLDAAEHGQRLEAERFRLTVDGAPIGMALVGLDGTFIRANHALGELFGFAPEELVKVRFQDLTHPQDLQSDLDLVGSVLRGEITRYELRKRYFRRDGGVIHADLHVSMVRDGRGEPLHFISQILDVTEKLRAEETLRARLAELSTPLIPIRDDVMVMPLIGVIDFERAERVLTTLLAGVSKTGARVAIVDVTGVTAVNEQVASALLRAAQAVRLLGTRMILSGIGPEVARTLISIGADLSGIVTCGNLQAAVAQAVKLTRQSS